MILRERWNRLTRNSTNWDQSGLTHMDCSSILTSPWLYKGTVRVSRDTWTSSQTKSQTLLCPPNRWTVQETDPGVYALWLPL
jgi:hypothetical protein